MNRIGMGLALMAVVGFAAQLPGFAEVSTRDDNGKYGGSRVTGGRNHIEPLVWTEAGRGPGGHAVLNPDGDSNGDLMPVVVDSNKAPFFPWVVWSRFSGKDYDLAWSRWNGKSWTAIRWVEDRVEAFDDLDPDLVFGIRGRPFVTWWREDDGFGRVFISVNFNGKWLTPSQVSMTKVDSRYPTIQIDSTGKINVEYLTPRGLVRQPLIFWQPTSITDNIDPHFELAGEAEIVGMPMDADDE